MEEMRMENRQTAVEILEEAVRNGSLASKAEEYLNRIRRMPDSFYGRTLRASGKKAAEDELADVVERRHVREFAASILTTAQGVIDLARVDTDQAYVKVITNYESSRPFFMRDLRPNGIIIVAFNPEWHGCGCNQPKGAAAFAQYGYTPLKAAIFATSTDRGPTMSLIFGTREQNSQAGFIEIKIELEGNTHNNTYSPHLVENAFLLHSLGLLPQEDLVRTSFCSGGSSEMYLNFPGSYDFLAKNIGKLGPYFSGMAMHVAEHKKKKE